MRISLTISAAGVFLTALIAGCSGGPTTPNATPKNQEQATQTAAQPSTVGDDHAHQPSVHGGTLVSIGRDNYHAEAVFEKGGKLRLYMFGRDETKVQEVESQTLTAYVKADGDAQATSIALKAEPQAGDKPGMTSLFVAELPKELAGERLEVVVPNFRIADERFRVSFHSNPPAAADAHGMPDKRVDAEEQKVYLTPGGKYTEADVKANGGVVASVKFQGFKAEHDLKPKPGDKICPVTLTKANPKCTWVVGGKTYEFCCPPCVDEFVALAKEKPEEIGEPESYRKK